MFSQCLRHYYLSLDLSHSYLLSLLHRLSLLLLLFFICRIRRLVDCFFLSFQLCFVDFCFCFVFLNNRWLHIVNRIYTVCFRSVYAIVICCLVYRILSCCYCFINFSFFCYLFFVCRIRRLIDFRFLALAAFSILCFASSFLTTVGCTLLIESTPFVFAVSTPALFVAWSIAFLAIVTASSTLAFLLPSLHLSH